MPKILYVWELGSGMGHLSVVAPVLKQLIERGCQVAAMLCDPTYAELFLKPLGIRVCQISRTKRDPAQFIQPLRTFAHVLHNALLVNQPECLRLCKSLQSLVEDFAPDLIICDHAPATLIATRGSRFSRVVWGTGFTCPPNDFPLPDWRPWLEDDAEKLLADEIQALAYLNAVLGQLRLPRCKQLSDLYTETTATLLTTYPELDHFGARPGGEYVGVWPQVLGDVPCWPDHKGRKIFAYLKDAPQVEILRQALSQLGMSAIVVSPKFSNLTQENTKSDTLIFSQRPLNMNIVAATCELAILNGTHTTVAQMLRAGKPVVSLPMVLEQQLTGMRTVQMEAGRLILHPTVENMAEAIAAAIQPNALPGAERFSNKYASIEHNKTITQIVERLQSMLAH